jgi:biopolymer transport protein ExbB/TolQ
MALYLNLSVVFQYDFVITYLAIMFFIHWILAKVQITRLTNVFRRVWEKRNRQIHLRRSNQRANKG